MKRYKPALVDNIIKPIEYKQLFIERNFYWDSIQEYRNKGYWVNIPTTYFIKESVIRPDKYVIMLYSILKGLFNNNQGRTFAIPELVCKFLNSKFKLFNIEFENEGRTYGDGKNSAINIMATNQNNFKIYVICSPLIKDIFHNKELQSNFLQTFKELIGHELIHRSQFLHVSSDKRRKEIFSKSPEMQLQYFSNKHEIMSFAWQIIEQFRFEGLTDNEILLKLKQTNTNLNPDTIFDYYKINFKDTAVLKLLYKYMYEYLKGDLNINEVGMY